MSEHNRYTVEKSEHDEEPSAPEMFSVHAALSLPFTVDTYHYDHRQQYCQQCRVTAVLMSHHHRVTLPRMLNLHI